MAFLGDYLEGSQWNYPIPRKSDPRAFFGKRLDTLAVPPLLDIQLTSYKLNFLQEETSVEDRNNIGLEAAFRSVFPITSFSGNAQLEYGGYRLGTPSFDVKECQQRGLTYAAPLRVLARLVLFDKEATGDTKKVKDILNFTFFHQANMSCSDSSAFFNNDIPFVIFNIK